MSSSHRSRVVARRGAPGGVILTGSSGARGGLAILAALWGAVALAGCVAHGSAANGGRVPEFARDGAWKGAGVCYGPHRAGQRPGGAGPTRAQLLEDLRLLSPRWDMLRMYGSRGAAETVLEIVRAEHLPIRVMVGAWIGPERSAQPDGTTAEIAGGREANEAEVATAIRLANEFPEHVLAIAIGNESQVHWSDHRVPPETLIGYLRQARAATRIPVTTADDLDAWLAPEGQALAREVDFIVTHVHAMWHSRPIDAAVAYTRQKYEEVCAAHPGRLVVLGEAGWATNKHSAGDQARLIQGEASEPAQQRFYREYNAWTRAERVANFFFEAFDEAWKGGDHPDEVEKHWGLFNADRTPKRALRDED